MKIEAAIHNRKGKESAVSSLENSSALTALTSNTSSTSIPNRVHADIEQQPYVTAVNLPLVPTSSSTDQSLSLPDAVSQQPALVENYS